MLAGLDSLDAVPPLSDPALTAEQLLAAPSSTVPDVALPPAEALEAMASEAPADTSAPAIDAPASMTPTGDAPVPDEPASSRPTGPRPRRSRETVYGRRGAATTDTPMKTEKPIITRPGSRTETPAEDAPVFDAIDGGQESRSAFDEEFRLDADAPAAPDPADELVHEPTPPVEYAHDSQVVAPATGGLSWKMLAVGVGLGLLVGAPGGYFARGTSQPPAAVVAQAPAATTTQNLATQTPAATPSATSAPATATPAPVTPAIPAAATPAPAEPKSVAHEPAAAPQTKQAPRTKAAARKDTAAEPAAPAATAKAARPTKPQAVADGVLVVSSRPVGAIVLLDGRSVGTTPLTLPVVAAGTHTVKLEIDGICPLDEVHQSYRKSTQSCDGVARAAAWRVGV